MDDLSGMARLEQEATRDAWKGMLQELIRELVHDHGMTLAEAKEYIIKLIGECTSK